MLRALPGIQAVSVGGAFDLKAMPLRQQKTSLPVAPQLQVDAVHSAPMFPRPHLLDLCFPPLSLSVSEREDSTAADIPSTMPQESWDSSPVLTMTL